ncbi:adenylyl-sulfate kinase [Bacillus andreraoultii]|uniref:adenylyl-sulfate kinase n=1 Tax=Bacillus andreraoultii TaxID=1499685 RepID=UPI00053B8923|nr:adenylyl-sulfate kinase [Bacillus andreraoultii]
MSESKNIEWHLSKVMKTERQDRNKHKSTVLWFTGLSGSGKSTISAELEKVLFEKGVQVYRLDGDNIRHGLNKNLGFSPEDRSENIRRIGEVAKLMVDAGMITLTAFISPYRKDRELVRKLLEDDEFIEVYVKARIETCEARDPKGLYKKVRNGEIINFTGIDAPYEEPHKPELMIDTDQLSLEQSVNLIIDYLIENGYIK